MNTTLVLFIVIAAMTLNAYRQRIRVRKLKDQRAELIDNIKMLALSRDHARTRISRLTQVNNDLTNALMADSKRISIIAHPSNLTKLRSVPFPSRRIE